MLRPGPDWGWANLTKLVAASVFSERTYKHKRNVLAFGVLGLFAKKLDIDLSGVDFYGVKLDQTQEDLIPGFLGLALIYSLIQLLVGMWRDLAARMALREDAASGALQKEEVTTKDLHIHRIYLGQKNVLRADFAALITEFGLAMAVAIYALWSLVPDAINTLWLLF